MHPFEFSLDDVMSSYHHEKGVELSLRVMTQVGDAFGWRVQEGWALVRVVQEEAALRFLGDQPLFFRPGMPITIHVSRPTSVLHVRNAHYNTHEQTNLCSLGPVCPLQYT